MTIRSQGNIVYIESCLGDVEYKFKFDTRRNPLLPSEFMNALQEDADIANIDEIKMVRFRWSKNVSIMVKNETLLIVHLSLFLIYKHLGHPPVLPARSSVLYANEVAEEKIKFQPEKAGSAADVMGGVIGEY